VTLCQKPISRWRRGAPRPIGRGLILVETDHLPWALRSFGARGRGAAEPERPRSTSPFTNSTRSRRRGYPTAKEQGAGRRFRRVWPAACRAAADPRNGHELAPWTGPELRLRLVCDSEVLPIIPHHLNCFPAQPGPPAADTGLRRYDEKERRVGGTSTIRRTPGDSRPAALLAQHEEPDLGRD